ncbi:MAG: cell division protein ZapB [Pseudomonadota bacterium]
MDNVSIIKYFDEVEQKIDQLLGAYAVLKKENIELFEKIERLEQELQVKSEAVAQYAQERDLVRFRIDGLLAKLGEQSQDALSE